MANNPSKSRPANLSSEPISPEWFFRFCLQILSSLNLTVVLFFLTIVLIFVGTMAQTSLDMSEVLHKYFRSWFVIVPLQVFFPEVWFPNQQNILGYFPYPGGSSLGFMLAINLAAAHISRFKVQAKSLRLVVGLGVILAGVLTTLVVILSGLNGEGLQGGIPFGLKWEGLWSIYIAALGVAALACGLASGLYCMGLMDGKWGNLYIALTTIFGGLFLTLFFGGEYTYVGDGGMRILWQLTQGGLSSVVLLIGCVMVFKQRGGIVLIHAGVGLMMFGELLVGLQAVEEQMYIPEGEATNVVTDIRSLELAITNRAHEDQDIVTVIPQPRLEESVRANREKKNPPSQLYRMLNKPAVAIIQHPDLPFDIEVVEQFKNSNVKPVTAETANLADHGVGLRWQATGIAGVGGASSSQETNRASAYVRFYEKGTTKAIGTYLFSQHDRLFGFEEKITVKGRDYYPQLRFKHAYKPYSIFLQDHRHTKYVGTSKAKSYESEVRLIDPEHNVDQMVTISMNDPMRHSGETFYQSGSGVMGTGKQQYTVLQVVKNSSWMIPYVACMLIGVGMCWHFYNVLLRFLKKLQKNETTIYKATLVPEETTGLPPQIPPAKPKSSGLLNTPLGMQPKQPSIADWLLPLCVVSTLAFWLISAAVPSEHKKAGEVDLSQLSRLPVIEDGRVKPIDTLARIYLRKLSKKEKFIDADGEKQLATTWMLDVMSDVKDVQDQPVYRVDNPELLKILFLKRRKSHLYSANEIIPGEGKRKTRKLKEFFKLVEAAQQAKEKNKALLHQNLLLRLHRNMQIVADLRASQQLLTHDFNGSTPLEKAHYLSLLADEANRLINLPFFVPTNSSEHPWESLRHAALRLRLQEKCKQAGQTDYKTWIADVIASLKTEENITTELDARVFANIKELVGMRNKELTGEDLDRYCLNLMSNMPPQIRDTIYRTSAKELHDEIERIENRLQSLLSGLLAGHKVNAPPHFAYQSMTEILTAYQELRNAKEEPAAKRAELAKKVNQAVASYQQKLEQQPPTEYTAGKLDFEYRVNVYDTYSKSYALYVIAFLFAALSWLFWHRPFNRTSFYIIALVFLVQTVSLVSRMVITERPLVLVTNLYSSAIAIGWAGLIAGMIIERTLRLSIGNVVASVAGLLTLIIAHQISLLPTTGDTMDTQVAVLDNSFWLATHVTCISMGYATTFVAGILGALYIAVGMTTPELTASIGKKFASMVYGVICFATFFSLIGTVLGGLWADDSWGRFWGWDPKENGALIIVLWNALILHARWGGLVKERGLAVLAVVGNIVTAWSWFGVNELGVGMHSYGFTNGVLFYLKWFVLSQLVIFGIGCLPKDLWWSFLRREENAHHLTVPPRE